jgi:hypothetical protein
MERSLTVINMLPCGFTCINAEYNNKTLILLNTANMSLRYLNFVYFCKLIF